MTDDLPQLLFNDLAPQLWRIETPRVRQMVCCDQNDIIPGSMGKFTHEAARFFGQGPLESSQEIDYIFDETFQPANWETALPSIAVDPLFVVQARMLWEIWRKHLTTQREFDEFFYKNPVTAEHMIRFIRELIDYNRGLSIEDEPSRLSPSVMTDLRALMEELPFAYDSATQKMPAVALQQQKK